MTSKSTKTKKGATRTRSQSSGSAKTSDTGSKRVRRRLDPGSASGHDAFLDDRAKRDIGAVVSLVIAVILFILAILPSDALVSGFASSAVHHVFGIGCYILPFVILAIGIFFLMQRRRPRGIARISLGCGIVFIALLGIFSLFAPIAVLGEDDPDLLFSDIGLVNYGGYVGAGIDWLGLTLFGRAITAVILIGLLVIGCIVIGLSISSVIEGVRNSARRISSGGMPSRIGDSVLGRFRGARGARDGGYDDDVMDMIRADEELEDYDPGHTAAIGDEFLHPRSWDPANDESGLPTAYLEDEGSPYEGTWSEEGSDYYELEDDATAEGFEEWSDPAAMTAALGGLSGAPSSDGEVTIALGENTETFENRTKEHPEDESTESGHASDSSDYLLPPARLLNRPGHRGRRSKSELEATAHALGRVLSEFGIDARVVEWIAGPTVTLFEVDLPPGVRVSRVTALSDDIALALASPGVRIFAPVPGTNYVGIEVPNAKRETVLLSEVLEDAPEGPLQIAIGKDVEGNSIVSDLSKMPHLLIGGTTGSGKSVSINGMIMSILMRATPDEVRFIMIDPKRVEFTPYNGIPHLYVPVVTEASEAASALAWGVAEMERRLKIFSKVGVRNIGQYNKLAEEQTAEEPSVDGSSVGGDASDGQDRLEKLPYLVIIIDELADLMMNVGKEVEISISRIAQLARAAGIHLIVATQRPSTNVVTGLIKSNITNRIAFNVASGIDSRVILDNVGAEHLIGLGDLLLSKPELSRPQRIQGCFVTEDEIFKVVNHVKSQGEPEYHSEILSTNIVTLGSSSPSASGSTGDSDPLIWEAADIIVSSGFGSTSNIQRRLKVGYARAGRIMDQLEELGVVGPANGSKPREVLVDGLELESIKAFETSE